MRRPRWISRWRARRRTKAGKDPEEFDSPESSLRRLRKQDPWRSRNPFNYGDPPGVGGLH